MNEINWKEKMKQNGLNHSFAHIQQQSCWKIARSWMAKVMLLILLFFVLCWQLIDSISMLHGRFYYYHHFYDYYYQAAFSKKTLPSLKIGMYKVRFEHMKVSIA